MVDQLDLFEESMYIVEEEKNPQKSSLTPRQWELYRLIKHNSFVEHRKTTQKEICDKINGYEWVDDDKVHDHCSTIWKDIKDNNESLEHDKIIISKNFTYWIGSEEETQKFLRELRKALEPRLKRYWNYVSKTKMDGLGKLFDKNNNPVDDNSKARKFYECFNDYNIELQAAIEIDKEVDKNEQQRDLD